MASTKTSERTIDEKGRVTIPKEVRKALGLEPGTGVRVAVEDDRIVVSPKASAEAFIEDMEGCITGATAKSNAPEIDPLDLKDVWTTHSEPDDRG